MDSINLTTFQLNDAIEEWAGFFPSTKHHQGLAAHHSQPYVDVEAECLPVEFDDLVRPVHCLDVHLQRLEHAA